MDEAAERPASAALARAGLAAGAAAFAAMLVVPAPEGLSPQAWRTAAVAVLMATWWLTEALPVGATALLPVALFPILGVAEPRGAAAPYADPLVFLFLGGFVLALAIERCGLHRRAALAVLALAGARPRQLVLGMLAATASLSLFVSNTASAMLMLPIALAVVTLAENESGPEPARPFAAALLLSVAYGASIGGMGTLIGTPPNALFAAFVRQTYGVEVGFATWLAFGLPTALVLLALAWLVLARLRFRLPASPIAGLDALVAGERAKLGAMSAAERRTAAVFLATALLWTFGPLLRRAVPGLADAAIAVGAAIVLFALPAGGGAGRLMDWRAARRLPWQVLILFGGGLSLAEAMESSGLAAWIGGGMHGLAGIAPILAVLALAATVVFLSELASNTAIAAAFLPLGAALAPALGADPALLLVAVALAATCGFMLPVGTPPNAIVYATGRVSMAEMASAGLALDLAGVAVVTLAAWFAAAAMLNLGG